MAHKGHRATRQVDKVVQLQELCRPHLAKHFMYMSVAKADGMVVVPQGLGVATVVVEPTSDQVEIH